MKTTRNPNTVATLLLIITIPHIIVGIIAPEEKSIHDLMVEWAITTKEFVAPESTESEDDLSNELQKRWAYLEWQSGPTGELCIAALGQTHFDNGVCQCRLCMAPQIMKQSCTCLENEVVPTEDQDTNASWERECNISREKQVDQTSITDEVVRPDRRNRLTTCDFPPVNYFMNATNKCTEGYPCSVCHEPFITKLECLPGDDTVCGCPDETYLHFSHGSADECITYPRCKAGEGRVYQPEHVGSTILIWKCSACSEGKVQPFSNSTGLCRPHRQVSCSQSEGKKLIPGNATHDPLCAPMKAIDLSTEPSEDAGQQDKSSKKYPPAGSYELIPEEGQQNQDSSQCQPSHVSKSIILCKESTSKEICIYYPAFLSGLAIGIILSFVCYLFFRRFE